MECNSQTFNLFIDRITPQDFLLSFEMVIFAVAHRYAFPHTDYIHYLQRRGRSGKQGGWRGRKRPPASGEETLLLFDEDQNVVADPSRDAVDVEYAPPSVRQLDRPMSVSRALMGVVPNETFSDMARMSMGGRLVVGEGDGDLGARRSGGRLTEGEDIVISREHAEGI